MTAALQSVQLFVVAGAAFLAIGSLLAAGLTFALRSRMAGWEPLARHRTLALLAIAPVLVSVGLLFSATLPSLLSLVVPGLDHCPAHDDGHAHLCFVHLPQVRLSAVVWLGLVLCLSYLLARALFAGSGALRSLRIVRALTRTGEQHADLGITIVETSAPVCLAVGFFRPRVLLSRGLLGSLSDEERAVVLAHERAHVTRRDALVASVVRAISVVHLPAIGRFLVSELAIAAEQACDEEAGRHVHDRLAVASAILTVERASHSAALREFGAMAVAFGECAVERRVQSLLAEPCPPASARPFVGAVGAFLVGLLVLADELHHVTESLLSIVLH